MRHHGTNGKNDGNMEGIPVDLDEGTVKHVAKMGDYVSMGERLVLRALSNGLGRFHFLCILSTLPFGFAKCFCKICFAA